MLPRRPGPGLLLAAAPTTPNATGHTDSTSTRALHPLTPTGTCLSRMRGRLARPVLRGPRLGHEPGLPDGAHRPDGQQTQLVSVVDHTHRLILTQTEVVEGNEIAAFVTALELLPELRGCLVTADALHTQVGHVAYLAGRGAHYLFTVKDNQPTLRRALAALPWRTAPRDRDPGSDRDHGRVESRTATVLDLDQTPGRQPFRGAQRAMKIVRHRTEVSTRVHSTETQGR